MPVAENGGGRGRDRGDHPWANVPCWAAERGHLPEGQFALRISRAGGQSLQVAVLPLHLERKPADAGADSAMSQHWESLFQSRAPEDPSFPQLPLPALPLRTPLSAHLAAAPGEHSPERSSDEASETCRDVHSSLSLPVTAPQTSTLSWLCLRSE